jgi:hypothetical protein
VIAFRGTCACNGRRAGLAIAGRGLCDEVEFIADFLVFEFGSGRVGRTLIIPLGVGGDDGAEDEDEEVSVSA